MNCGAKSLAELEADHAFIVCNLACGGATSALHAKPPGCDCATNMTQGLPSSRDEDALHDPRFWSNLRGIFDFETAMELRATHDLLDCRAGMSVHEAWKEGSSRHGTRNALPLPFLFTMVLVGLLVGRRIRTRRHRAENAA